MEAVSILSDTSNLLWGKDGGAKEKGKIKKNDQVYCQIHCFWSC